jgi:hypothetical protein
VRSVVVLAAKVGVRSRPVVKLGPLDLSVSQQTRLRRLHGSRAYIEATKELRIELDANDATPRALVDLLSQLVAVTTSPQS